MAELTTEDKIKLAVQFISQSPPGQVNDVIQDIAAIIGDNDALTPHVAAALREYNLAQMTTVEHAAEGDVPAHVTLLSEAHIVPGSDDRYIDNDAKRSFTFDHVRLVASEYEPYVLPEADEAFRAALASSLLAYAKNHFTEGCASVSTNQVPVAVKKERAAAAATPAEEGGRGEVPSSPGKDVESGDEVDAPRGLEKLDEEIKEEKEKEDKEDEAEAEKDEDEKRAKAAEEKKADAEKDESKEDEAEAEAEAESKEEPVAAEEEEPEAEPLENPLFVLEIVGNRYKPNNFWTGRWRTRWTVDRAAGTVSGVLNIDVHYYEQGNVQLSTSHTASFPCPTADLNGQSIASQIVTAIAKVETNYQLEMNDTYEHMGGNAFRSLRRALPVTRQKIDWDKVQGYALGADLSRARA